MGIIYSLLGWTSPEVEDPTTGLTPRQFKLVRKSWAVATKDRTKLGIGIMMGFFDKHPQYKQLFPFKDMSMEELPKDAKFKVHCDTVVRAFDQIVDVLENTDILLAVLEKIASNHLKREVPPQSFLDIQSSIEGCLRPITNEETFTAWSKLLTVALTFIKSKMEEKPK